MLSLFSSVLVFNTALSDNGLFNIEFYCKITIQKLTVIGMNRTKRREQFLPIKTNLTWTHSEPRTVPSLSVNFKLLSLITESNKNAVSSIDLLVKEE